MTLAVLASSIIIIILVFVNTKRQRRNSAQEEEEFWARERRANSVRRKSLDNLNYISVPLETFPTHVMQNDSVAAECIFPENRELYRVFQYGPETGIWGGQSHGVIRV